VGLETMTNPPAPQFPDLHVTVRSRNRWAVRGDPAGDAPRRERREIDRFVAEALRPRIRPFGDVCRRWVDLQLPA
jgi:hypothetical protein